MSLTFTLNRKRFFTAITGSASGPVYSTIFPCDYRFSGNQNRTIFYNMNASDTLTIQASPDAGASAASVWYNVTSINGQANGCFSLDSQAPFGALRAALTGGNGAATVEGLV